jgi:hypothetical protein
MKSVFNTYFDKVFCVTCFAFSDRHDLIKSQLKHIDFDWVISPPARLLPNINTLTQSEASLILGHMECIQKSILSGYNRIAIFEDDNVLTAEEDYISKFFDSIPSDWDCLYMANANWNEGIYRVYTTPYSENVNKVTWATGSGLNGIQKHVYMNLLNQMNLFDMPVDKMYYQIFGRGNSYSPTPYYFSNPISMPTEHIVHLVKDMSNLIPSRIIHSP